MKINLTKLLNNKNNVDNQNTDNQNTDNNTGNPGIINIYNSTSLDQVYSFEIETP